MREYQGCTIDDIISRYIEGTPAVSRIPLTHDIEEGVENMGSLWDRAVAKGVDKGILDCLYKYINRKKVSIDETLEDHDIPSASRQQYSVSLNKMLGTGA